MNANKKLLKGEAVKGFAFVFAGGDVYEKCIISTCCACFA